MRLTADAETMQSLKKFMVDASRPALGDLQEEFRFKLAAVRHLDSLVQEENLTALMEFIEKRCSGPLIVTSNSHPVSAKFHSIK
jgi:hypothetical protein